MGLPRWLNGEKSACHCRRYRFDPWVGKILWGRKWKIPWTEEPGGLQSMGSQRVGHDLATKQYVIYILYWCVLYVYKYVNIKYMHTHTHTHIHIYFLQLPITPFLCHSHTSITDVTDAHLGASLPPCFFSAFLSSPTQPRLVPVLKPTQATDYVMGVLWKGNVDVHSVYWKGVLS